MTLEEITLYNVLRQIKKGEVPHAAPNAEYMTGLAACFIINKGWDYKLTPLGESIFNMYDRALGDKHYNGR